MHCEDFAGLYEPVIPDSTRRQDAFSDTLAASRDWSHQFGQILHNYLLTGQTEPDSNLRMVERYVNWQLTSFPANYQCVYNAPDSSDKYSAMTELFGQWLQGQMLRLWQPILNGRQHNAANHASAIQTTKEAVAFAGLAIYRERENAASAQAGYRYFDADQTMRRGIVEGALTEFDAAIVLAHSIRKLPQLTVVPGPMQFEHGRCRGNNADFVVIDTAERQAIGVQVKTAVRQEDSDKYNGDAIVLVSGTEDFGNQLAKRTRRTSSALRSVNWAGLICAHIVTQTTAHGGGLASELSAACGSNQDKTVLLQRMLAKQMLGTVKPNLQQASGVVGKRVLARLYGSNSTICHETTA